MRIVHADKMSGSREQRFGPRPESSPTRHKSKRIDCLTRRTNSECPGARDAVAFLTYENDGRKEIYSADCTRFTLERAKRNTPNRYIVQRRTEVGVFQTVKRLGRRRCIPMIMRSINYFGVNKTM